MLKPGNAQVYSNLSRQWGKHGGRLWDGQPFVHPSSFDTLVLDHALKRRVRVTLHGLLQIDGKSTL